MPKYPKEQLNSIHELIAHVAQYTSQWECEGHVRPWFRGQTDAGEPPLPSVLPTSKRGQQVLHFDEFHLTTMFRLKAPAFGAVPDTRRLDQWLFLMQHYGLPTRLLDWTENPLAAAFFAATGRKAKDEYRDQRFMAVWVLHPIQLNLMTNPHWNDFPNTWKQGRCLENFKIAFGTAGRDKVPLPEGGFTVHEPTAFPLAVQPSTVATRVAVQRSCFTVHGTDPRDFEALFSSRPQARVFMKKYVLPRSGAQHYVRELEQMGVSDSTLFPDFEGLAREMKRRFLLPPKRSIRKLRSFKIE